MRVVPPDPFRWPRALLLVALGLASPAARSGADVIPLAALDTVLERHVRGGRVDYRRLAEEPCPLLRFLGAAAHAVPERGSRAEQIAFWVNVYNARVLEGVIRRPGLASVRDPVQTGHQAGDFFGERRLTARRRLSLDDIEHRILRARFREPRIHFVLNCAAASCPALPSRALRAASLDSALEASTRRFLADPSRNRIAPDGALELSSIFQWYANDFVRAAGSVPGFVARHGLAPGRRRTGVRFLPYDWSLNGSW